MKRFAQLILSRSSMVEKPFTKSASEIQHRELLHNLMSHAGFSTSSFVSADASKSSRVWADFSIYKGRAALSMFPVLPKFNNAAFGVSIERRGAVMLKFTPAIPGQQQKYDWEKKQRDNSGRCVEEEVDGAPASLRVACGQPWFGRWGYKLHHGCFGITESKYQKAVEILGRDRAIRRIIATYQKSSETQISTLGDLLRCILNLKAKLPFQQENVGTPVPPPLQSPPPMQQMAGRTKASRLKYFSDVAATLDSRWSKRRMELAAEVIVETLTEAQAEGRHGMTRQDMREVAREHIGDTSLLDFVLKSLGGCVVGDQLVRRMANPSTRVLEFSIQEVSSPQPNSAVALVPATPAKVEAAASLQVAGGRREEVDRDIWYVYKHALEDYPVAEVLLQLAAQVVLDCKHFSKVWLFKDKDNEMLRFFCGVVPDAVEMEALTRGVPASELVVVPPYATVGDLRRAGEHSLRDGGI